MVVGDVWASSSFLSMLPPVVSIWSCRALGTLLPILLMFMHPWSCSPGPAFASSCRLAACFLWSLAAQSEQVLLLLVLQLFLPIFLILGWISYPIPPEGGAQTSHSFHEPLSLSGRHLFCPPVFHSAPALQVSPTGLRTSRSSQQVCPDTLYSKASPPPPTWPSSHS